MMDRYSPLQMVGIYLCLAVFLTFILLPFVEMFMASLRPLEHLFRSPYQFWSDDFSFEAYSKMWDTVPLLGRYIFNSVFISTAVTLITMILVIPAAYAFARLDFPYKNATLGMFLGVNMFTGAVLLIPLYRVLQSLGLLNSYWAMIIPGVAFLIPTGIWLLRSYLEKIPRELEEAAYVDGASRIYILRRVVLPLAIPGLIVVGVAVFIGAYAQQFLFAITLTKHGISTASRRHFRIHWLSVSDVNGNDGRCPCRGTASHVDLFVPSKYLVAGLTAGAIKE